MIDHQPLGVAAVDDEGRWTVRFERRLRHDRHKVWRAITESQHLAHWLPTDIVGERRAGATIDLPFWPNHVAKYHLDPAVMHGEIHVWDPPSVFEWTWETDRLRFELTPVGEETLLTFTTWLGEQGYGVTKTAAGYHVCFANLEELLDTGTVATPLVDVDPTPLERRYEEQVGAASGS